MPACSKIILCLAMVAMAVGTAPFVKNAGAGPIANVTTPAKTPDAFHRITIVDGETSRGIPMVRARLTNKTEYYTDSAGVIAFQEPDLWNCDVELTIESYGYTYPKDWFGAQTARFTPVPGGETVIAMQRTNIAQRLYRTTGSGIYRDSVLLGDKVPPTEDPSPMHIMGIDGSETAVYKGRLLIVRGDTGISATGLGNFKTTGIWVDLPGIGGLDPEVGILMHYIRQSNGRPKPMVLTDHRGPVWLGGLRVARDASGNKHLFGDYLKVGEGMAASERGLALFDDAEQIFEPIATYPPDSHIRPEGTPFIYSENGDNYYCMVDKWVPDIRCKTDRASIMDIASYETFTCLREGESLDLKNPQLDRDAKGRLQWAWKKNTDPVTNDLDKLVKAGHIRPAEAWFRLTDVQTGKPIQSHGATVYWNSYRQRWICLQQEEFGTSWLGEIWFFEADTPLGPWAYGCKIATHSMKEEKSEAGKRVDEQVAEKGKKAESQSFYCIKQHPEFDKENGRIIFFEGTLSMSFSDALHAIPRYDYNQLLYKVELDDSRLALPVPVYRTAGPNAGYHILHNLPQKAQTEEIAFYAPDRPRPDLIPIFQIIHAENAKPRLSTEKASEAAPICFYAVDARADIPSTSPLSITVPLYEHVDGRDDSRLYSIQPDLKDSNLTRNVDPFCRVWPKPMDFNPLQLGLRMAPEKPDSGTPGK